MYVDEFKEVINKIDDLVCFLYDRYKANQKKLDNIREVINNYGESE